MDLEIVGRRGNAIIVAVSFDDKGEAKRPRLLLCTINACRQSRLLQFLTQPIYISPYICYTSCTALVFLSAIAQ